MHVAPPIKAASEKEQIRPRHHHRAAVTSAHATTPVTSRQGRQQRNPQPHLNSVNHSVRLVHTDLPFAKEVKQCGGSRNATRRALLANRTIFSA
jgi:hypothetical protein